MKQQKLYTSAPLPFVGQKRRFIGGFREAIKNCPANTIFIDLFGGSGLLSHVVKRDRPDARVIYNDYDNYRERIRHIDDTNQLLAEIRSIIGITPKSSRLPKNVTDAILEAVRRAESRGYVDFITLSSAVMFSMKYVNSYDELLKEAMYNNIRNTPYVADGYLDGLDIVSTDYREVFTQYKDTLGVVFLVDPPYLSTEVGTYTMTWRLSDYLDVLTVLQDANYFYFTSNKSSIVELCEWIAGFCKTANPFAGAKRHEHRVVMNHNARYTDMMLYKLAE